MITWNYDLRILISLQPDVANLCYIKLWIAIRDIMWSYLVVKKMARKIIKMGKLVYKQNTINILCTVMNNVIKTCTDNNVRSPKSVILESDLGHYTI